MGDDGEDKDSSEESAKDKYTEELSIRELFLLELRLL